MQTIDERRAEMFFKIIAELNGAHVYGVPFLIDCGDIGVVWVYFDGQWRRKWYNVRSYEDYQTWLQERQDADNEN